jgi:uncharacterized RmlC-like cupin family protein
VVKKVLLFDAGSSVSAGTQEEAVASERAPVRAEEVAAVGAAIGARRRRQGLSLRDRLCIIARTPYRLGPGDSIYFPATVPHAIHNDTGEPARVLWVLTPRLT